MKRKVLRWAGIEPNCEVCQKPAFVLLRRVRDGKIKAAACKEHADEIQKKHNPKL